MHGGAKQRIDQIVHVDQVIEPPACSQNRKHARLRHAEELPEPAVSGTVDRARPHHRTGKRLGPCECVQPQLGLGLGALIIVIRSERRLLVGRRIGDVSMHPDGRHVNEAPEAGQARDVRRQPLRAGDVDPPTGRHRAPGLAVGGGEMKDVLRTCGGGGDGACVVDLSADPGHVQGRRGDPAASSTVRWPSPALPARRVAERAPSR